jgi:hypothetical protein
MPAPVRALLKAIGERLAGSRPGALRALLVSIIAGFAAAIATYRLLRSGG